MHPRLLQARLEEALLRPEVAGDQRDVDACVFGDVPGSEPFLVVGAMAALAIQYSGIEHKTNKAIEEKVGWTNDAELEAASSAMEHGQLPEAIAILTDYVAVKPNSLDAWNMLRQIHTRQNNTKDYVDATAKTCALHLKAHEVEAAFHGQR